MSQDRTNMTLFSAAGSGWWISHDWDRRLRGSGWIGLVLLPWHLPFHLPCRLLWNQQHWTHTPQRYSTCIIFFPLLRWWSLVLTHLCSSGYTKLPFKWFDYLRDLGSVAAPVRLFNKVSFIDVHSLYACFKGFCFVTLENALNKIWVEYLGNLLKLFCWKLTCRNSENKNANV